VDNTLPRTARAPEGRVLATPADALSAAVDILDEQEPPRAGGREHWSWCVPAMHAAGDDRCVSAAVDVAPHVASWLGGRTVAGARSGDDEATRRAGS
jgi:hypothetical protein